MREDLLHYIWKFRKLKTRGLSTSNSETLKILNFGTHNLLSGPDFFNARIEIAGQQWAGNVEMHVRASDWYLHNHHQDKKYKNVILHVVWNNDIPIFRPDNCEIPTLELQHHISEELFLGYNQLFSKRNNNFINCENDIGQFDKFTLDNWLERLFIERLERKSKEIELLLKASENNWEKILFLLLLKNFGLKINGEAFMGIGKSIDFSVIRKTRQFPYQLESILFGMAGLLESDEIRDNYYLKLKEEYKYLKNKFKLDNSAIVFPEFFKLRPLNFPTIRLSQFVAVYTNQELFSKIIGLSKRAELITIFQQEAHEYWKNHYVFGKLSSPMTKKLSHNFIDLLLINTILPLKFCYSRYLGKDINDQLLELISELKVERNSIVANFETLGVSGSNAMKSQALLQLYNEYCIKNNCLQCVIGTQLLNGK